MLFEGDIEIFGIAYSVRVLSDKRGLVTFNIHLNDELVQSLDMPSNEELKVIVPSRRPLSLNDRIKRLVDQLDSHPDDPNKFIFSTKRRKPTKPVIIPPAEVELNEADSDSSIYSESESDNDIPPVNLATDSVMQEMYDTVVPWKSGKKPLKRQVVKTIAGTWDVNEARRKQAEQASRRKKELLEKKMQEQKLKQKEEERQLRLKIQHEEDRMRRQLELIERKTKELEQIRKEEEANKVKQEKREVKRKKEAKSLQQRLAEREAIKEQKRMQKLQQEMEQKEIQRKINEEKKAERRYKRMVAAREKKKRIERERKLEDDKRMKLQNYLKKKAQSEGGSTKQFGQKTGRRSTNAPRRKMSVDPPPRPKRFPKNGNNINSNNNNNNNNNNKRRESPDLMSTQSSVAEVRAAARETVAQAENEIAHPKRYTSQGFSENQHFEKRMKALLIDVGDVEDERMKTALPPPSNAFQTTPLASHHSPYNPMPTTQHQQQASSPQRSIQHQSPQFLNQASVKPDPSLGLGSHVSTFQMPFSSAMPYASFSPMAANNNINASPNLGSFNTTSNPTNTTPSAAFPSPFPSLATTSKTGVGSTIGGGSIMAAPSPFLLEQEQRTADFENAMDMDTAELMAKVQETLKRAQAGREKA
eukprot:TRINITY_DN157_c2_g1_i1.p1 TRINITY_DN157_c2_g1~~TRINITY_DN157_c2_g1_i1.p1  ORF type:complete len:664 (+),score=236.37 TRINITY_DN157_c2_g1_i1:61-1992(+)